jgi:glutamate-5-semialdehyde dehydrogenase
MAIAVSSVADTCAAAKRAARTLARTDTAVKNAALEEIALALESRLEEILIANERDMQLAREADIGAALLDRLRLDEERVVQIAHAVRQIVALADPVGEVISGQRLPNGLDVRKVRVPLGVVAVVYEARPNVTIDAAALCLKSGNAIVLRGSSSATHSNAALAQIAGEAAVAAGLPDGCVSLVWGGGRAELAELATQRDSVDLIIPRGGEGLKDALQAVATVPVIYAASGNCHVYVDAAADLDQALAIVLNAKTQRPGGGVHVRADERAQHAIAASGAIPDLIIEDATDEDWATEYLAPIIAVGVVDSVEHTIEHIARHGSGHSEAIVTRDTNAARAFQLGVDAACVYVNASTRFTDGGEFGMGAEIGNSTQKLHARGPIGLRELCTFKYLVEGDGHVRA